MVLTRRLLGCVALVIAVSVGSAARADVLYNNFGPGDSFNTNSGWTFSGAASPVGTEYSAGTSFVASSTASLTQIDLALFFVSGTPNINLALYADNGSGQLGSLIESYANVGPVSGTASIHSVMSVLHPILTAGQQYWVVGTTVDDSSWLAWNQNSTNDVGNMLFFVNGSPSYSSDQIKGTLRVMGQIVPEPASVVLCGLGLLGLAGYSFRRHRRAAA